MNEKNEWSAKGAIDEAELNKVSGGRSFVTVPYYCGVCGMMLLEVKLITKLDPPSSMMLHCERCGCMREATPG